MKKLISLLFALAAIAPGVRADTYYGFEIEGTPITSANYQSQSEGKPWSYDPNQNILYLTDGIIYGPDNSNSEVILIEGDLNSSLNICVQGKCYLRARGKKNILFTGEGHHVIYGTGELVLDTDRSGNFGISSTGNTSLTIQDITMQILAYSGRGIESSSGFSDITIKHCEITIITGTGAAWVNSSTTQASLVDCHVQGSCWFSKSDGILMYDTVDGELQVRWAPDATIKRFETISQVNITVQKPVPGTVVDNTISVDNIHVTVEKFEWFKSDRNYKFWDMDDDVFEEGCTYMARIYLKTDSWDWQFADDTEFIVNGHHATIELNNADRIIIRYYFNTYNLMVDGVQVTWDNKDNVLGASFDPSTNTLTLDNFNVDTQMEYEWCVNNNNDMSTFDYDFDVKDLTIKVKGSNTIRTDEPCLYLKGVNLTITGSGELNLTSHNGNAIDVTNGSLTLAEANVYAKGKTSAIRGNGSEMTVNHSSLEARSAEETQATILDFTAFQMTDSYFEDVYDDHDQVFYNSEYLYYDTGRCCLYYYGEYGKDGGFDQSFYDNPYVWLVKISPTELPSPTGVDAARLNDKGQMTNDKVRAGWYTLDGRKLDNVPTAKGVYVRDGRKVVIQ